SRNTITNNERNGITLEYCKYSKVIENDIINNSRALTGDMAFFLLYSKNTTVIGNNISKNNARA
ncbi:unnamed protein product, partial [marine sediment metagenome]